MITSLLVGSLAVTWAWEALRAALPWSLPSWLQPFLVLVFALAFAWPGVHLALGIAGGAGIIRALVRTVGPEGREAVQVHRGIGSRIPPLP